MDFLASCYKSNMRLFKDRPDILTPGRWRWSPPGAKMVPFPHIFASQFWDDETEHKDPPLGEVRGSLGGCNGFADERYKGQNFCGAVSTWQNGAIYSQHGTPAADDDGIPFCCQSLPHGPGGVDLGGDAAFIFLEAGAVVGDRSCIPNQSGVVAGDRTRGILINATFGGMAGDRTAANDRVLLPGVVIGDRTLAADQVPEFGAVAGDRTLYGDQVPEAGVKVGDRSFTLFTIANFGAVAGDRSVGFDSVPEAGVEVGDRSSYAFVSCFNCPGNAWGLYAFDIVATGPWAFLNGHWDLFQGNFPSTCFWRSGFIINAGTTYQWSLRRLAVVPQWQLVLTDITHGTLVDAWVGIEADCMTVPFNVVGTAGPNLPGTIVITT